MYKIGMVAAGVVGVGSVGDCWEGVPLTTTPPSDEHQLDAVVVTAICQNGIVPKAVAWMQRGAAGFLVWKSVTFSGAFSTLSAYSQEFPSTP
jgi:hypothetical protein